VPGQFVLPWRQCKDTVHSQRSLARAEHQRHRLLLRPWIPRGGERCLCGVSCQHVVLDRRAQRVPHQHGVRPHVQLVGQLHLRARIHGTRRLGLQPKPTAPLLDAALVPHYHSTTGSCTMCVSDDHDPSDKPLRREPRQEL
jgi:hypothetical protein